jgi:hypothetical protein
MKFRVVKEFRDPIGAVQIVGSVIECDRDRAAIYFRHGLIGTIQEMADVLPETAVRTAIIETATESPSETADDFQAPRKRAGRPRKQG